MANKLIILFNDTNDISSHIDPSLGVFRQGDVGHEIYCHFESFANYNYGAYIMFERADGSKSPELPMTLADFPYGGTLYSGFKLVIDDEWIMAQDGSLKATVRVRNASGTVVASGLVPISLEKTVYDESPDITVEQYNALVAMLEGFITDDSILYPHVLTSVPEDLTDFLVNSVLFVIKDSGDVGDFKLEVYRVDPSGEDKVLSEAILIDSSLIIETFSPTNYTPTTSTTKGHFVGIDNELGDIITGDQVVGRAVMDEAGNNIRESYGASLYTDNDDVALKIAIRNKLNAVLTTLILREATTTKNGLLSSADKVKIDAITTDIATAVSDHNTSETAHDDIREEVAVKQPLADKNQINGYAGLDASAKIPTSLLPDSIVGQLEYQGVFDCSGGAYPAPAGLEKGYFYICSVSGTISGVAYVVGDWLVYNGTTWDKIDNTDAVASVNGKLGAVVLKGTDIKVSNADDVAIDTRILAMISDINNRYTKAQTYSTQEIEQRITDIIALHGLQDTAIEKSEGVFVFNNGDTLPATTLAPYNWVLVRFFVTEGGLQDAYYSIIKPTEVTTGNRTLILVKRDANVASTRYAEVKRVDGNITFAIVDIGDTAYPAFACTAKVWGIKLSNTLAENVNYDKTVKNALDSENVQDAIDELADEVLAPAFVEAEHLALRSEITATDTIEIKDDSGELVKITGNEPTNLVSNSDLLIPKESPNENEPLGFSYSNCTDISLTNGIAKFTATAQYGQIRTPSVFNTTDVYYTFANVKADQANAVYIAANVAGITRYIYHNGNNLYQTLSIIGTYTNAFARVVDLRTSDWTPIEVDYMGAYNVSDMIRQGVKNDNGIPFADLTNEEIKEQLDIWHEVGYPTHINKLISKSDNLFNGKFNTLTSLASENLVANSDLLIDSNSDNIPDGFTYGSATDISLTNGIAKFTATAQHGNIKVQSPNVFDVVSGNTYYFYSKVKTATSSCSMLLIGVGQDTGIINDNNWHFTSKIFTASADYTGTGVRINDNSTSDFTPIEVDYIGAINITDLVYRGILPSGLTNAQYKDILDNAIYNNVPLRESDFISVEPSVAYRLIKASENGAIHKVIEYATNNQIVKVNSVDYSGNVKISAPITMNALTRKVKLISDLMDRVPNKTLNGNFSEVGYWTVGNSSFGSMTIANNKATITITNVPDAAYKPDLRNTSVPAGQKFIAEIGRVYYTSMYLTSSKTGNFVWYMGKLISDLNVPVANTRTFVSSVITATIATDYNLLYYGSGTTLSIGDTWTVESIKTFDITDFKNAGVVDDNGTLFSRLTNDEIKDQMDIWVQNGFPDAVINDLYPDGADTAISLKYNDGNAIYYPQVIDELPLDITLRADEYWQDGYIIKQNGNAEASPLGKVFSAWNYGQIEAIYDSGVPADFKVKYAQNTSAQVSTHSEYLKEARERLDTLRVNQEQLIKKLGIDVENDDYDSFVGITSDVYEYYQLEGVKSGNILKVEIAGQSVKNLLVNTIASSITGQGLTITYDDTTGMFTVNGTSTGAGNIILKTGMNFGLPVGTTCQLMRYFDSGTINLNGSYVGYVISGTSVSNRINENSESLYDPYINGVGDLKPDGANPSVAGTSGQTLLFQVYKAGMVFTDFKFKVALYEGTKLLPFAMPDANNNTDVDVYNRTANLLDMGTSDITYTAVSGITIGYNTLAQEFVISGTATADASTTLKASVLDVVSGDRVSIKRVFQSGDITAVSTLPTIELYDGTSVVLANSIYKMTAPEGETPTPDISFNMGTIASDGTLSLRLTFKDDDVFSNYRFRLMIHDKSTDIGYVAYNRTLVGSLTAEANETDSLEFPAIDYGVLEFIPKTDKLNIVYGDTIADTDNSVLEYNAGIQSANRKLSVLESRITALDNPFRDKVIAIWGDSRESNNPTSDPQGVGDQKDTSYPAILAKKLGATVLNFGLSGGAWAENTVQQDAASAIVNRVLTEDTSASADVIIISSMNDFKLATPLGSPLPANKTASTFYGAMRLTYDRLGTKYPAKKIWLVLPQKRYDETTNYGGGSYLAYRKAQIEVAREYGIPTIDLYNNFPNADGTAFETTNMLNPTHFSAIGNDLVAELIARALLGNGNGGSVDVIPTIPTAEGTYTLKVVISETGIPTFSWVSHVEESDYTEVDITDLLVSTEDYTMTSNNLKAWKQGRVYGVCGIISLSLAGGKSLANQTALITAIPEAYRPNQSIMEHTDVIFNGLRSFQLKNDGVITVYPTAIAGGALTILIHIDFVYNK